MIKNFDNYINDLINKIDLYCLNTLTQVKLNEIYNEVNNEIYRAIATFDYNIKYFKDFKCTKIALINYPTERYNKHSFKKALLNTKANEYEFVWNIKYELLNISFWNDIVNYCNDNNIILRPMLELSIMNTHDIKKTINFLNSIKINDIVTCTGLISDTLNIDKWNRVKHIIPPNFNVKINGIYTTTDIENFIKSDVKLIGKQF